LSRSLVNVFAYGSNLSTARITDRIGAVEVVGVGMLQEHALRFHKRSQDGSAKADAHYTGSSEDRVYGVVYALTGGAKRKLDDFEGVGTQYLEAEIAIELIAGRRVTAVVYRARGDKIGAPGRPYDWYQRHVLVGAREHRLPGLYVDEIAAVASVTDPDRERSRREFEISSMWFERS
jgi:gamma-glutamylcyclotransferase